MCFSCSYEVPTKFIQIYHSKLLIMLIFVWRFVFVSFKKCCFLQVVLAPDVVARTRRWVKGVKEVCTGGYLCQAAKLTSWILLILFSGTASASHAL